MRTVRVAVDNRLSRSSGPGVYLRNITRRLVHQHADRVALTLIGGTPLVGTEQRPFAAPLYSLREQVELPRRIPPDVDVVWIPNYNVPIASRGRLVATIYDANHLALPGLLGSPIKRAYAKLMFANVRRRADRIICISHFSAREVSRLAGVEPSRIEVIHCAVDDLWRKPVDAPRPMDRPYMLFVGNVKPHKNLPRLLQAFERLAPRIPHSLVVVGRREGFLTPDRAVLQQADRLGARVHFTGQVDDDALRAWYAFADALVYPSLYEGFGLPPLEAMASGIPVVASSAASIPEVCGEAALYFHPESVDEMTTAIERALGDEALRARLVTLGKSQIDRYSWDDAAARTADVLASVEV